jgi:hypothetical protein
VARTTYFGRIARGAKGAAADAVLSPPKLLFRPPPRLPFAAGVSGHELIDDNAANQRSSPGIDRKVASREEPLFAGQQSSAGDAIESPRQPIAAGRERMPSRDFDAQFSAMQTQSPAQTPDTPASAGVSMRERRTDAAERRLESAAPRCFRSGASDETCRSPDRSADARDRSSGTCAAIFDPAGAAHLGISA